MSSKPSLLLSILRKRCPKCRQGSMYKNNTIFPLKEMFAMPEHCEVCGQKMEIEPGFYYGTGYVSYGLSIALSVFNLIWFWLLVGLSFKDNSMFWYLGVNVGILIILQPIIARYARVLYLYMFVKYGEGDLLKKNEEGAEQSAK